MWWTRGKPFTLHSPFQENIVFKDFITISVLDVLPKTISYILICTQLIHNKMHK